MSSSVAGSGAQHSSKNRDLIRGSFFSSPVPLVFLLSLALYLCVLPPSIVRGGDTGELIAASYTLGIAHPSGYPLWCLLGKIFSHLPFGEVAWRYNLFSALCGASAAALIAATAFDILLDEGDHESARRASMVAGMLLAGFFFFGSQALLAEIYGFAALEGAALLFFGLRWKRKGDWRDFYTFVWLAGLSPFVHLSGVFLWFFLAIWALWKQKGMTAGRVAIALLLGCSSLVFTFYFILRSSHFPVPPRTVLDSYFYYPMDWGHPASLLSLKNHITAAQYSGLLKPRPLADLIANATQLFQFLFYQYLWATPLLFWGAIAAFKRGLGWILGVIFLANVVVEIQYDVSDQSNFFFPAYLVMAIWMAFGWYELWRWLGDKGFKLAKGNTQSMWPWRMKAIGFFSLAATVGAQWGLFAMSADQKDTVRPRDGAIEAAVAAEQVAKNSGKTVAALYTYDDTLWAFWYAKYALEKAPHVETPWGRGLGKVQKGGRMVDYVAQLKRKGPVVLAQWDEGTDQRFPLVMLTTSGNLCLASGQSLPPAAVPLNKPLGKNTPGPNGLMAARFRRDPLWRSIGDGLPAISPSSMAAFEVDFQVAENQPAYVEVLLVREGKLAGKVPSPTQGNIKEGSAETGAIPVYKQRRRLVLASDAKTGQMMRLALPLQIEPNSPQGEYEVWTRLIGSKEDAKTGWTRTDGIRVTAK